MGRKKRFESNPDTADERLDIDMDDDFDFEDREAIPEELLVAGSTGKSGWRLIEQLREQRQLQMQLEDFDQYVI